MTMYLGLSTMGVDVDYERLAEICEILIRVAVLPNPFVLCTGVHVFSADHPSI